MGKEKTKQRALSVKIHHAVNFPSSYRTQRCWESFRKRAVSVIRTRSEKIKLSLDKR